MNISMVCFSPNGHLLMDQLKEALEKEGHTVDTAAKSRYLPDSLEMPLSVWCKGAFVRADALIFIGASGIAVRTIAPFVATKTSDPAVLVIDELGRQVISLLSGHLGGANALTLACARLLGALPVITTATDLNGRFAVDVYAKKENMTIFHMKAAKAVSAALLAGETVGLYSEYPIAGELPKGLVLCGKDGSPLEDPQKKEPLAVGIAISIHKGCLPFEETTTLVPKTLHLGLGCRRGKEEAAIEKAVLQALESQDLYPEALKAAASIDLKAKEQGLLEFCRKRGLPFITYSEESLKAVEGEFTPSAFVKKTTGVDNVCERAAIRSGGWVWIQRKKGAGGVTTALAEEKRSVTF